MKQQYLNRILAIEAIICLIMISVQNWFSIDVFTLITFPLLKIAALLRYFSLSGDLGNLLALVIYIIFCSLPLFLFFYIRKRSHLLPESYLLPLLSLELFIVIYILVNPGSLSSVLVGSFDVNLQMTILSSSLYAVVFAYGILTYLRKLLNNHNSQAIKALEFLLFIGAMLCVFIITNILVGNFIQNIRQINQSSEIMEIVLTVNYLAAILQTLIAILPYAFNVIIILILIKLLKQLNETWLSDEAIILSKKMSKFCTLSLVFSLVGTIFMNLFQLLFLSLLINVNFKVSLPLVEMIFVLACYVLSHFLLQSKKIKEDNELFI